MNMKYFEKVMMWKAIRFIKNWMYDQGKWMSLLALILSISISVWFTSQIPGMSVMAVVYSLLVGAALMVALDLLIRFLSLIVSEAVLYKTIRFIDKLNSYKGGF